MVLPLLLIIALIVLILYIREKIRAYSVKALLLKSAESALFLAVGAYGMWRAAARGTALLCPFALMGLVCGLMGDLWLDLKYVFPEKDRPFTLAGFSVFGIGHVFYVAGLLLTWWPAGRPLYVVIPLILAVLMSVGNVLLEKPMKLDFGALRPTVAVYGFLLFSTLTVSGSLALAYGWSVLPLDLFFAGAVLFTLSDLVLSGTYFGVGKERPVDITLNYLTYYGGQFLIASSLVALAR